MRPLAPAGYSCPQEAEVAKVSLTSCSGYGAAEVGSALARCLEPLGGLGAFCRPGQRVLLKPNLIAAHPAEAAATTHPQIVLAVAAEILRLGRRWQLLVQAGSAFGRRLGG